MGWLKQANPGSASIEIFDNYHFRVTVTQGGKRYHSQHYWRSVNGNRDSV